MRKFIYEVEGINMLNYLEKRIIQPQKEVEICVCGEVKVPLDISQLVFSLGKETTCFYSLYQSENKTIEVLELKGLTIEISSSETVESLFSDLSSFLGILFVSKFQSLDEVASLENALKINGCIIVHNKLKIPGNTYPLTQHKNSGFYIIQESLIPLEKAVKDSFLNLIECSLIPVINKENTKSKSL